MLTISVQNQGLNEDATNAQIDTLILDNRKKLNQVIGMSHSIATVYLATPGSFVSQIQSYRPACRK